MRIGPERTWEEKESTLHDWVNDTGCGIMGLADSDPSEACLEFIRGQFVRFGIPFNEKIEEVFVIGAQATFYTVDVFDPYSLLVEASDVTCTDDWSCFAYEIPDSCGKEPPLEAEPERMESFRYVPGQAEHMFNYYMSHPGLENLPHNVGEFINEHLEGYIHSGDAIDNLTEEAELALRALCLNLDGTCSGIKLHAYFQLAAWATFVWLAGPLGRDLRHASHDIFTACLDYGEAILYEGSVLPPQYYVKLERPPKSCVTCGLDSWCVEMTFIDGITRNICEHCLNGNLPRYGAANCGSKVCKYVACRYHPAAGTGMAGLYTTLREKGQLLHMASEGTPLKLGQLRPKTLLV